nr:tRNA pseudouridine(38-40) synthase [Cryptococcus depauperatus CBS 7855]
MSSSVEKQVKQARNLENPHIPNGSTLYCLLLFIFLHGLRFLSTFNLQPTLTSRPRTYEKDAQYWIDEHDYRNFYKSDGSKQTETHIRTVWQAYFSSNADQGVGDRMVVSRLVDTAFLWHQVHHIIAVLFLIRDQRERLYAHSRPPPCGEVFESTKLYDRSPLAAHVAPTWVQDR